MRVNLFPACGPVNAQSSWGKIWLPYLKPALNFQTGKLVRLNDWRLGLCLRCAQIMVILYTVYDVIYNKQYLANEIPLGILDSLVEDDGGFSQAKRLKWENTFINKSLDAICNNPQRLAEYDYAFSEHWNYTITGCDWPALDEVSRKSKDATFIPTQSRRTTVVTFKTAVPLSNNDCLLKYQAMLENNEWNNEYICEPNSIQWIESQEPNGMCACRDEKYHLRMGVENVSIVVQHTFYTTFETFNQPETVLRRKGDNTIIKTWKPGQEVRGYLWEYLQWAGVDLDKSMDEAPNRNFVPDGLLDTAVLMGTRGMQVGSYPKLRTSGLKLTIDMNYYNHGLEKKQGLSQGPEDTTSSPTDTICIMEISPTIGWTSLGPKTHNSQGVLEVDYSQGVLLSFQVRGQVGKVDVMLLITQLVNGMVLLNVANLLVMFIACYCMGLKSPFFQSAVREDVTFKEEYARYAAQLVSAAKIFDMIDSGDEHLDKYELYKMVRQVVLQKKDAETVSEHDTMALVGFLLDESDSTTIQTSPCENGEVQHEGQGKTLDNPEWVAAFTGGRCNLETFQGYIRRKQRKGLYPEGSKEEKQKLRAIDEELLRDRQAAGETAAKDPLFGTSAQKAIVPKVQGKDVTTKSPLQHDMTSESSPGRFAANTVVPGRESETSSYGPKQNIQLPPLRRVKSMKGEDEGARKGTLRNGMSIREWMDQSPV